MGPGLHLRPVCADHAQPPLSGLWTLCLVPVGTTVEGWDPLWTPESWRSYPSCSLPKRKCTVITPVSGQVINIFCIYQDVITGLLIINCLECNCGLIDYWPFEHVTREWWGYCSCIYPTFVYVSLKGIGVVGLDTNTWGIKDFHKCWSGSWAKRRLCLGPTGVINCTPLSALSFRVSLFPGKHGYNTLSMGFSRQEYWSGLPFPSPGDLPNSGIEAGSPALQADTLTSEPPGKPGFRWYMCCQSEHTGFG